MIRLFQREKTLILGKPLPKRTYPEDDVESEKQIFHTFHPTLHFAHDATWFVGVSDLLRDSFLFCSVFQLDINPCNEDLRRYTIQTWNMRTSAAARHLHTPISVRECWGTQGGVQGRSGIPERDTKRSPSESREGFICVFDTNDLGLKINKWGESRWYGLTSIVTKIIFLTTWLIICFASKKNFVIVTEYRITQQYMYNWWNKNICLQYLF